MVLSLARVISGEAAVMYERSPHVSPTVTAVAVTVTAARRQVRHTGDIRYSNEEYNLSLMYVNNGNYYQRIISQFSLLMF